MLKATVWARRCPSQGQATPARLSLGALCRCSDGRWGGEPASESHPRRAGIHNSVCRQTQKTEGKTCTYTNHGINLKDKALTPLRP